MTDKEFIDKYTELREEGMLQEMYKRGIITHKPIHWFDIYKYRLKTNLPYRSIKRDLRVSIKTISKAIAIFS